MFLNTKGNAGVYALVLLIGLILGGVVAIAVIQRVSGNSRQSQSHAGTDSLQPAVLPSEPTFAPTAHDIETSRNNAIVRATKLVSPSVVGVVVTQIQVVESPYYADDFFDHFFAPEYVPSVRQVENMGSGFVIREDGLILTNYHVIVGARQLFVNFSDGRRLEGSIVGVDPQTDIALISVKAQDLVAIKFGDSDHLMIGEWAIAIGNPFLNFINDAHPTVTVGVVSALDRNFAPSSEAYYQGMIQTDAAINPGNSGGPLINALGEVIAINTFIFTGSKENRGSIGIGFAIPINRAHKVVKELLSYGKRRPIWTGIAVQNLSRSVALALGIQQTEGVVVVDVTKGSPGERIGLRPGDLILKLGARRIQSAADIEGFWLDYLVGDRIKVVSQRRDKQQTSEMELAEYPRAR